MRIEILGPGCNRCQTLAANAKTAADELGLSCEIIKMTEINEIVGRGIMMTPALVINGTVKTVGKVIGPNEIQALLTEASRGATDG